MAKKSKLYLILFLLSFILSLVINFNRINIPYFNGLYEKVSIDIIYKNYNKNFDKVLFNSVEAQNKLKIDNNHYLFSQDNYKKIKKIDIENKKNIIKKNYYTGNKIQFEDNINNSKTFLDKISVSFLSFFYNFKFYLIPYVFLILFLHSFKGKINNKNFFYSILFIALILRICQINSIPFWDDEIYILSQTAFYSPLKDLFNDPGNPFLYPLLFKIYRLLLPHENFFRFSSVILGLLFNLSFYYYLKTTLNKKTALLGFFVVSINIPLIYFSQELRCYILFLLLGVINSILLFKFKVKNKFLYFLSSLSFLYTHFYAAFAVFINFLAGNILFFKNKKKLLNFILVNLFSFLLYIPLIIYKKEGLLSNFNSWLDFPDIHDFSLTIKTLAGNEIIALIFLIVLFCCFIKIKNKKEKLFIKYNFSIIILTIIFSIIFSYLIKPIFYYRYFYIIYFNYLALCSYLIMKFLNKPTIAVIFLILFTTNQRINYQNLFCNHNLYLDFIRHDIKNDKKNYVFLSDTVKNYRGFEIKNAEFVYVPFNEGINEIDIEKYNLKKPCRFYILNLYLSNNTIEKVKNIELHKSPLGVFLSADY